MKSVGCTQVWHSVRRSKKPHILYSERSSMTDQTNTCDKWTQWTEDHSEGKVIFSSKSNDIPINLRLKSIPKLEPAQLHREEKIITGKPVEINSGEELLQRDDPAIVSIQRLDTLSMAMEMNAIPIIHQGKARIIRFHCHY